MVDDAVIGSSNILGEEWSDAEHELIDRDPKTPPVSFSTIATFVRWDENLFGSIKGDQCFFLHSQYFGRDVVASSTEY